jgi:hypothetical protein
MKKKIKKISKKNKEKRGKKYRKFKINFDYQKSLMFAFIISALLLSFSVFYYYVFFMPTIEREKLEQQKTIEQLKLNQSANESKIKNVTESSQKKESQELLLTNCLNTAKEAYFEVFTKAIADCNKKENNKEKYDCVSPLLQDTQKGLEESQDECLKINQSNGELNIINSINP